MKVSHLSLLMLLAVLCGWAGAWTALRQIPPDQRRPRPLIATGERHRLPAQAVGSENPRALRDWHFAAENNIPLPQMLGRGQIVHLEAGVEVEILRSDLDLVFVRRTDNLREYWLRAIDVDPGAGAVPTQRQNS